ncbi:MAG: VOC family protein [Anaerolineales bacterium]
MNRVVHFEIHATNPKRAMSFYSEVFGWRFEQWGESNYWLIETGPAEEPGINGGLLPREIEVEGQDVIAYVCTIDVESVRGTSLKVGANGGQVIVPKTPLPGMGWHASCKDTEGNLFGLIEYDEAGE